MKHPSTATSYNDFAIYLYSQGELDGAYNYIKKAVTIRSKVLLRTHPNLIESKEWLVKIEKKLPLTKT